MNRILGTLAALVVTVSLQAAVDDSLLMFSTQGPDYYADKTVVLDGECYALCYVYDNPTEPFAIRADGTATAGGEVLLTAPIAKDGHCPELIYVIPAAKAAALTGGSYAVYLLDTRVKQADGSYTLAGVSQNKAKVVNGSGAVAEGGTVTASMAGAISTFNGTYTQGGAVMVATVIDQPAITAIKMEGAQIKLTVSGLSPLADYKVMAGTSVQDLSKKVPATVEGNAFTVNAAEGSFFKVMGTRKVAQ